jgi:phosphatidylserine/phosphatidylglycerophosphate/cardiolipin synthase-like enzyme
VGQKTLTLGLILSIWLSGCGPSLVATPPESPETAEPWIQVYFSDPNRNPGPSLLGGPDEPLQEAIEAAHLSIDAAFYDMNLYNIRDALIEAQARGVTVRLVLESDNYEEEELRLLRVGGIQIVLDERRDLMHNKFVLIDHYELWTGSMNLTVSDTYGNRNNVVAIRSTDLAQNYLIEFEEMFLANAFGPSSPANTRNAELRIEEHLVETYFSPEDETLARLVDLVNRATESVHFLAFSFTSDDLAAAISAANDRGVLVQGVMDASQATGNQGGEYQAFLARGIDVRLDGEGGSMHHKVLIIDGEIVVTGSYNFSASAEEHNDENTLVIYDSALAELYMDEFWRVWEFSQP